MMFPNSRIIFSSFQKLPWNLSPGYIKVKKVNFSYLVKPKIQNLQCIEVLEESTVNLGHVIGGQIKDYEAVQASEDSRLDPVFIKTIAR